jgi:hypothetical protein
MDSGERVAHDTSTKTIDIRTLGRTSTKSKPMPRRATPKAQAERKRTGALGAISLIALIGCAGWVFWRMF